MKKKIFIKIHRSSSNHCEVFILQNPSLSVIALRSCCLTNCRVNYDICIWQSVRCVIRGGLQKFFCKIFSKNSFNFVILYFVILSILKNYSNHIILLNNVYKIVPTRMNIKKTLKIVPTRMNIQKYF